MRGPEVRALHGSFLFQSLNRGR